MTVFWPQNSTNFCSFLAVLLRECFATQTLLLAVHQDSTDTHDLSGWSIWLELLNYWSNGGHGIALPIFKDQFLFCEVQFFILFIYLFAAFSCIIVMDEGGNLAILFLIIYNTWMSLYNHPGMLKRIMEIFHREISIIIYF